MSDNSNKRRIITCVRKEMCAAVGEHSVPLYSLIFSNIDRRFKDEEEEIQKKYLKLNKQIIN